MHQAADSIFDKIKVGGVVHKVLLSETDAETIDPRGYSLVNLTQAGADETRTLGNGEEGQELWIICTAYAADVVMTAALAGAETAVTFNADEDAWHGIFLAGEWRTLLLYGSAAKA